jgi:hypothetical protein
MTDPRKYIKLFGDDAEKIDYQEINQALLDRIAKSILNKHQIINGDKEFRICEIEFYIMNESHNDEYTHQDEHQMTYGKWYFHRTQAGNYKSGTYKGVDLTLGNADSKTHFGVLIRSICSNTGDEHTDKLVEGPCKTVNHILELNGCKDVKEFMVDRADPLYARSTKNFHIKRCTRLKKYDVYSGPRIGLSKKYPEYKDRSYRYVIMKDGIKKDNNDLNIVE